MPDQATIDTQGGTKGGEAKPQPTGKQPPRSYRVLVWTSAKEDGSEVNWLDFGLYPGATQEAAIKKARAGHPDLRKRLADGSPVAAVPESYFEPLTLTVETVEVESFKKVKLP